MFVASTSEVGCIVNGGILYIIITTMTTAISAYIEQAQVISQKVGQRLYFIIRSQGSAPHPEEAVIYHNTIR